MSKIFSAPTYFEVERAYHGLAFMIRPVGSTETYFIVEFSTRQNIPDGDYMVSVRDIRPVNKEKVPFPLDDEWHTGYRKEPGEDEAIDCLLSFLENQWRP